MATDDDHGEHERFVSATAVVSADARLGDGTLVWEHAQIREGASLGVNCVVGKDVYVDEGVVIGNNVKLQNGAYVYKGVTLEDGVFVGPRACLTNDRFPRAITPDGDLKRTADWTVGETVIRKGASVGAGAVVLPGIEVGEFAMVGAGAVVTHDVPAHGLAVGVPARLAGYVCKCGAPMHARPEDPTTCASCGTILPI